MRPLPKVTQQGTTELGHTLDLAFFVPMTPCYRLTPQGGHVATQGGSSESQGTFSRLQAKTTQPWLFTQALGSQRGWRLSSGWVQPSPTPSPALPTAQPVLGMPVTSTARLQECGVNGKSQMTGSFFQFEGLHGRWMLF